MGYYNKPDRRENDAQTHTKAILEDLIRSYADFFCDKHEEVYTIDGKVLGHLDFLQHGASGVDLDFTTLDGVKLDERGELFVSEDIFNDVRYTMEDENFSKQALLSYGERKERHEKYARIADERLRGYKSLSKSITLSY